LNRIFGGLPYRDDWSAYLEEDILYEEYSQIITELYDNPHFNTQEGKGGNYLELYCYPKVTPPFTGNAIRLFISLVAPIAAYGEANFSIDSYGGEVGSFEIESTGITTDPQLRKIGEEIRAVLLTHNFDIINGEFASKKLPQAISNKMKGKNFNGSEVYFHGIFQFYEAEEDAG
jgi:hypothetical protein